jgi:hypothetical protein
MMASNRNMPSRGPRPRDGSWPQGGQSVLDEKRSFARHLELASDAGRKVSRSSGGTFANDHAVGKLRIIRFRHFIDGLLALASLDRACQDHRPGVPATLTTTTFNRSSLRWLEIST